MSKPVMKLFLTSQEGEEYDIQLPIGTSVSTRQDLFANGTIEVTAVFGAIPTTAEAIRYLSPMKHEELRGRSCTWRLYGVREFAFTVALID